MGLREDAQSRSRSRCQGPGTQLLRSPPGEAAHLRRSRHRQSHSFNLRAVQGQWGGKASAKAARTGDAVGQKCAKRGTRTVPINDNGRYR